MASLLIFFNAVGGSVSKVNVLGNEVTLSNPSAMPTILGIVLFYFLLRFVQYSHELRNKGVGDRFWSKVREYLQPNLISREYSKNEAIRQFCADKSHLRIELAGLFGKGEQASFPFNPPDTAHIRIYSIKGGGEDRARDTPLRLSDLLVPYVRAIIYIFVRTPLVTDYVFPYLLAALAYATYSINIRDALRAFL